MMRNRHGIAVLDRRLMGLGPAGRPIFVEPGEYPFTVMDGDNEIITLGDPADPSVLIARLPMELASELRDEPSA